MPEWQGAGVGMRFLNHVCERYLRGENRYARPGAMLFHRSHPGLCAALRRDAKWFQKSAGLFGANKLRSARSLTHAARKRGGSEIGTGFGGHFRAVQGFKYVGFHSHEQGPERLRGGRRDQHLAAPELLVNGLRVALAATINARDFAFGRHADRDTGGAGRSVD